MSSPEQDPRAADLPEGGEVIAHIPDEEAALRAFAKRLAEVPEGEPIGNEIIQEGLTAMVRLYSVKFQLGERWEPFSEGGTVPATAAMIMCTTMLKAVNVEVFELGMWQSWSGA
jgi:hypothetical protein